MREHTDAVRSYRPWIVSPQCGAALDRAPSCVSLSPIPTPYEQVYSSVPVGSPPKVVAWAHKFGHLRAMARSSKASYGNAASAPRTSTGDAAGDAAIEATIASEQAPLKLEK